MDRSELATGAERMTPPPHESTEPHAFGAATTVDVFCVRCGNDVRHALHQPVGIRGPQPTLRKGPRKPVKKTREMLRVEGFNDPAKVIEAMHKLAHTIARKGEAEQSLARVNVTVSFVPDPGE